MHILGGYKWADLGEGSRATALVEGCRGADLGEGSGARRHLGEEYRGRVLWEGLQGGI